MFAELPGEEVLARTAQHWSLDGPVPMPVGDWLRCPVCRSVEVQARHWMYHRRPASASLTWRCDVRIKCCECAAIWTHGVALPDAYGQQHGARNERRKIGWREAKRMLARP